MLLSRPIKATEVGIKLMQTLVNHRQVISHILVPGALSFQLMQQTLVNHRQVINHI